MTRLGAPTQRDQESRTHDPSARVRWMHICLILASLVIGVVVLVRSDENAIGKYGLISALPVAYFVVVFAIVVLLVLALRWRTQQTCVLALGVVSLLILVHGSATLMESAARFPTAWLHAGFVESIMELGTATPTFDARFSWPGFFAGAASLTELTGVSDPTVWLRWAPVVLAACYIPPLLAIGRATLPGWRGPWIAVIVFVLANWVGQDYFAPQTVAYIMLLGGLAIALNWFRRREPGRASVAVREWTARVPRRLGWLASIVRSADRNLEPAQLSADQFVRVGLLVVSAGVALALMATHQLTPAVLIVCLGALAALGRLRPWPIVIFAAVGMLGWVSYGAYAFWSGHLSDLFGSVGKIGQVVDSGVANRLQGSDAHMLVLKVRMALTLAVWSLAGLGAIRLWRAGRRVSVPLLVLMIAPMFIAGSQGYGGEGILRMFFFSLPGAAMLIAALVSPRPECSSLSALIALTAVIVLSFPAFLLARWGNEDFERISAQDVQLRQALYQAAPLGSTIATLGYGGTASYQDLTLYSYAPNILDSWPVTTLAQVDALAGSNPIGTYFIISRPQVEYGVINDGLEPQFASNLVAMLVTSGEYKVVFGNSSGVVLKRVPSPRNIPSVSGSLQ